MQIRPKVIALAVCPIASPCPEQGGDADDSGVAQILPAPGTSASTPTRSSVTTGAASLPDVTLHNGGRRRERMNRIRSFDGRSPIAGQVPPHVGASRAPLHRAAARIVR